MSDCSNALRYFKIVPKLELSHSIFSDDSIMPGPKLAKIQTGFGDNFSLTSTTTAGFVSQHQLSNLPVILKADSAGDGGLPRTFGV